MATEGGPMAPAGPGPETHALAAGEGRTRVQVTGVRCGPDLVLVITGGTHPHVGAVSLASPRPSLRDPARRSATASVLTVLGHKEDELARWAALEAARVTGGQVAVAAGIHVDAATPEEIEALVATARDLVRQWLERWGTEGEGPGPGAY